MFDALFQPLQLGPLTLKNRVMSPPHGHLVSSLWGSEDDAAGHIAYWKRRADVGWVDGVSAHVRNPLVPGFDPTGVGAQEHGHYRQPWFVERVGRLADVLHAEDTVLTVQMILQGGMPHGASAVPSGPVASNVPHALRHDEIDWFVEEYAHGAAQVAAAGADGIELHLNHDDLMEHFVSPLTNRRTDEYGGSLAGRLRFATRVLTRLREAMGGSRVVGVRLTMVEEEPAGYDLEGPGGVVDIVRALEETGLVDYVSLAAGSPWGSPSYIQSHHHRAAEWAPLAGVVRAQTDLPVVYTGRVTSPESAAAVLEAGQADVVGIARGLLADPDLLAHARAGAPERVRPCVGGNECINRRLVDNLAFSCAVNPAAGREARPVPAPAVRRRILVVGGGPAGTEVARAAAERGHDVTLWEAQQHLGGQIAVASRAPAHEDFAAWLTWQEGALLRAGVAVELGRRADLEQVLAFGADEVVCATGATPRTPDGVGLDLPHVHQGVDVLAGRVTGLGEHVLVASADDHMAPLSVADHLASRGHRVTLVHGSPAPAPAVSRYILGSALARLDAGGVTLLASRVLEEVREGSVTLRHVHSQRRSVVDDVDAVVLSCSAVPQADLYEQLRSRGASVHLLGDAFAPRTMTFATRQAHDLAQTF